MSKVKICGLSREDDIRIVNRVLPDFIGFVFAPSRRRVDLLTAAALKRKLDPRIKAVGVFVNENIDTIAEMHRNGIIDMAQLHGDEDEAYMTKLKESCGCPIIKAVGVGSALPPLPDGVGSLLPPQPDVAGNVPASQTDGIGSILPPLPDSADYLLFDTLSQQRGGTGRTFDWDVLKNYAGLPYFLSGGLGLHNVSEAIKRLSPFCVDVSSGVETDGVKNEKKIDDFVRLVRGISLKQVQTNTRI